MNDYLEACLSDVSGGGTKDYAAFQETFCKRCRNGECKHAKWAADRFSARVSTQVDRFFNNPNKADQTLPKYAQIPDFNNLFKEALRQEIADRRGDWVVPGEEPPERPSITVFDPQPVTQTTGQSGATTPPVQSMPKKIILAPTQPGNTPKRSGIILPGGPVKVESSPPEDPWVPKAKVDFVKPGAVIQMGKKDE